MNTALVFPFLVVVVAILFGTGCDAQTFGTSETFPIPSGLLYRETGTVTGGYQLLTSNGDYFFNLCYGRGGTAYNGYSSSFFFFLPLSHVFFSLFRFFFSAALIER
jgi:hypothetical protein